jgi:type II restriction enzyme
MAPMNFEDLKKMYDEKKKLYAENAYLHVSEIFEEAREEYKRQYLASNKAKKLMQQGKNPDAEQSWKGFKGKNFERLVLYIISSELGTDEIRCIPGASLNRKELSAELSKVHRNLIVRYGAYSLLPDADLVAYNTSTCQVRAVISCKITLRERVAQTAYWKLKLASDPATMHIKGYFITTDEDGDLVRGLCTTLKASAARNRIIVEHELDGTYTLRQSEESDRVKMFGKFIDDLRALVNNTSKG